jgi:hypothetical protein
MRFLKIIPLIASLAYVAQPHPDSRQQLAPFEIVSAAKDWAEFYKAYKQFGKNADGVVAETFSDKVSELLADRWDLINDLRIRGNRDKRFMNFVMYYLQVMGATTDQDFPIRHNAINNCFPKENKQLCQNIIRSLDRAWERVRGKKKENK